MSLIGAFEIPVSLTLLLTYLPASFILFRLPTIFTHLSFIATMLVGLSLKTDVIFPVGLRLCRTDMKIAVAPKIRTL